MQHWDKVLTPEHRAQLPRCHGMRPKPPQTLATYPEEIPEPDGWAFTELEPTPVVVRRGTAQVFTQAMLHSSWHNSDTVPRKGFILSWAAAGVPVGFVANRLKGLRTLFPVVRQAARRLQPGREHIVPTEEEFCHFETGYESRWEETFVPGKTAEDRIVVARL